MRHARTLEEVAASGLCIGCGICESLAGREQVEMEMIEPGRLRPKVKAVLAPDTLRKILDVCPGHSIDGALPVRTCARLTVDPAVGPGISATRGFASDDGVRYRAAAGGALTALGMYLLDHDKVDFVLHVGASAEAPMRNEARVSFDSAQVMATTASRYGPAAPLVDVARLLDQGRRFALIGKPCDVSAMRNLARWDSRVETLVPYMLTISCAGVPDLALSQAFLERHGLREDELADFRYRGHGWPGPTHATAKDGRVAEETYLTTWYGYGWKAQFRCKICPDHTGEQADVSSVDDWPGGVPERDVRDGWSLILARTPRGEALVAEAAAAGYLSLEPAEIRAMRTTQPHQVRKKQGILARLVAMWLAGAVLPRYRRIRVLRAALTAPPLFHLRNFRGARRRLRAGGNREPLP